MQEIQTGCRGVVANVGGGYGELYRKQEAGRQAAAKEAKAKTRYGVFPHSEKGQPTGRGHTVRSTDEAGTPHDHFNYGGVPHTGQLFKREGAAQAHTDKLNAGA